MPGITGRPALVALALGGIALAGCETGGLRGPGSAPGGAAAVTVDALGRRYDLAEPGEVARRTAAGQPLGSTPGEVTVEPATLHSLGVRWPVRGDANADAEVRVAYRRPGEGEWRPALSLFRVHPSRQREAARVPGGWLFAGSIVGLAADTEYEVRLALADPDGGGEERVLALRTLAEPVAPAGMRVRHVAPGSGAGGTGTADDAFRGLAAAESAAAPGDVLLLQPGTYPGRVRLTRHGEPGRPIVYRAAAGGVVLDGLGGDAVVDAQDVRHVWLEGLVFRNARHLVVASGAQRLVVRRSTFEVSRDGLVAQEGAEPTRGLVVTDNVFRGPSTWPRQRLEGISGITLTGHGNVVAHNLFTGVADGVHGSERGHLAASDIHDNDIDVCTDDGIETDYAETNVRVFRNRISNCFAGISFQPVLGGPVYVFRNAIYNVQYSPFKLHNDTSGILLLHNTSVRHGIPFRIDNQGEVVADVVTRNNLFLGVMTETLVSTGRMLRCDFDADGYSGGQRSFATWNRRVYRTPDAARAVLYRTHGARILGATGHFASGAGVPADYRPRAAPPDLRLRPDSAAVDRGVVLPNVSDGYAGRAPDLGCCEAGQPLPVYGPRPR